MIIRSQGGNPNLSELQEMLNIRLSTITVFAMSTTRETKSAGRIIMLPAKFPIHIAHHKNRLQRSSHMNLLGGIRNLRQ